MKNDTLKTAFRVRSLFHVAILLMSLPLASGCRPDKPPPNPAAHSFKTRMQAKLDQFSPELSKSVLKKNRKGINTVLGRFSDQLNGSEENPNFFLAILDKHGLTIASKAQTTVTGAQNYGNYQVVSDVLTKRRVLQSSLYLQGGSKVYIICSPLLSRGTLAGALIIGVHSDYLKQFGISERDFMGLNFTVSNNITQ